MISDFALLLSHEGIALAHRSAGSWVGLGQVALSDTEFTLALEALRKKGLSLAPEGFTTRIVLPDDQIKYLKLPSADDDDRETTIREALEAATPYPIDELAYDWEDGDDGMNVAAVARDTLKEAEEFAENHGFNPVSFVASPADEVFSVEPFFGMTEWVKTNLPDHAEAEAELSKVVLSEPLLPVTSPEADNSDVADELSQADDAVDETPEFAPEDDSKSAPSLGPAKRGAPEASGGNAPRGLRAGRGLSQDEDHDLKNREFPAWAGPTNVPRPFSLDENVDTAKIAWLPDNSFQEADIHPDQPPSWMGDQSIHDSTEDETDPKDVSWIPPARISNHPALFDKLSDESEQMKVFGERATQKDKERPLNMTLIGGIAVAMLVVILGGYFGLKAIRGSDDPAVDIALDNGVSETAEVEAEVDTDISDEPAEVPTSNPAGDEVVAPDADSQDDLTESTITAEISTTADDGLVAPDETIAPQFEATTVTPFEAEALTGEGLTLAEADNLGQITDGLAPAPLEVDVPEDQTVEADTEMPPLRPTDETVLEEVATTLSAPKADVLIGAAQDWDTLSQDAKLARYAATGIWPVAPEALQTISGDTLDDIFLTTLDPKVFATDAYAIAAVSELLSDKALTNIPNPPAPGTRFERDDRGLIQATAEGAMTPDGIFVFAAVPPKIPPLAPRPDAEVVENALRSALAGKAPKLRPDTGAPTDDVLVEGTGLGGDASKLPPLRPAAIAALAEKAAVIQDNPLAIPETPFPKLRPTNFAAVIYATERAQIAAQTTRQVAPTARNVADEATEKNILPLREISLIGIYGSARDRRALVRLASGRYVKIEVGDSLENGRVSAIDVDKVYYVRGGQTYVLKMP